LIGALSIRNCIYSIISAHNVNTYLTIELAASGRYQILSNRHLIKYGGGYCIIIRSSSLLSSFSYSA